MDAMQRHFSGKLMVKTHRHIVNIEKMNRNHGLSDVQKIYVSMWCGLEKQ